MFFIARQARIKEAKTAEKERARLLYEAATRVSFYINEPNMYNHGGEEEMEKKSVTFKRTALYQDIWELSLTTVAKNNAVPYSKLKEACEKADIPLPTASYWSNYHIGKPVEKVPLPEAASEDVIVEFAVHPREMKPAAAPVPAPPQQCDANIQLSVGGDNCYERETLYNEVWEKPVTKVAEKYGVSDVMIHKVCKTLDIPVPPRGYWAKKQAGQSVDKTPLPPHDGSNTISGRRVTEENRANLIAIPDETLSFLSEDERYRVMEMALNLRVTEASQKLHNVLKAHKLQYSAWAKNHPRDEFAPRSRDSYRRTPEGEPPLWLSVSESILPRLYQILNTLYAAIEDLGGSVNPDLSVQIRGERISMSISEGQTETAHVLTRDEQKQWEKFEQEKRRKYSFAREPIFRKYDHIPSGKLTITAQRGSYFRDSKTQGLEMRVGEILMALYAESETVRIEREAKEAAKRKEEEEKRQKELFRQRRDEEIDRLEALDNAALDYSRACRIRAYIAAIESSPELLEKNRAYIQWAKAKADWYDPTIAAEDPLFGKRKHGKPDKEKHPTKSGYHWW